MKSPVKINSASRLEFIREVEKRSREKIPSCYQCGKCTAGCPIGYKMTHTPNQIIRMIQLGMRREVLSSKTIWLCSSCFTCAARCPCSVSLTKIMDTLKIMAQEENISAPATTVPAFNRTFLKTIEKYGRLHELALVMSYKKSTRQFLKDTVLGIKMFLKHKIGLFPDKVNKGKLKKIFNKETRAS